MNAVAHERAGWIGPAPAPVQQLGVYFVGIVGVMFAGVGPLLLGGLQAANRLTAAQLGQAGMAELLTMGISAAVAGPLLGVRRLRMTAIACGLLYAFFNEATTRVGGNSLTLVRALNGIPSGVLIWMITGLIVRSPNPARGSGIYMTVQTLAQLLMVGGITAFILAPLGVDGGFRCLAVLGFASAVAGLVVPAEFSPLRQSSEGDRGWPPRRGWVALAAVFCFQAFILAFWIYIEPLSRQSGHSEGTAGLAISLSLGAQVIGGSVATLVAGRVSWFRALIGAISLSLALLGVLATLPGTLAFLAASAAFGFLWIFAAPFLTPLTIEADPSRRAAMLGPGASLLGCSAGPFLASLVVTDTDVRGSLALAMGIAALCLAIVVGLHFTRARPPISG